jgi:hypothetical protein
MPLPLSLFLTVIRQDELRNLIYLFCIKHLPNGEEILSPFHHGSAAFGIRLRSVIPSERNIVLLLHKHTRDFYRLVILTHKYDQLLDLSQRLHAHCFRFSVHVDGFERLDSVGPICRYITGFEHFMVVTEVRIQ